MASPIHHSHVETGSPKLDIIVNVFLGLGAFVFSFIIPHVVELFIPAFMFVVPATIMGLSVVDIFVRLLQCVALYFSIRASRIAIKKGDEKNKITDETKS